MRPVDKGQCPYTSIGNYREARPYLIERLGELCSYCEMHLDFGLAVEHVQPKSRQPKKECEWDNLLLACGNCNPTKGDTDINDANIHDYLWPDMDNTFVALKYSEGGIVSVNEALPEEIKEKTWKLIQLVGLDKTPDVSQDCSDRRWQNRCDAWNKAKRAKARLAKVEEKFNDDHNLREEIVDLVEGYFSIWMTVFADDADMKRRFIDKFVGTAKDCFDEQGNPVPKGQVHFSES